MENTNNCDVVIENLSLAFDDVEVLKNISLTIKPGEFFSFLGPSGSGKSTLLRAIAGFGPIPKGRILIAGKNIANSPPWERNVGMVFQSYALWPHMTIEKNVAFGLEERKIPKHEINDRVYKALSLVNLTEFASRRPTQLSGGQQQRVALARTIVIAPKVLLLDEPLSNLDANLRVQMRKEILSLQRKLNLTTIFVTHDQEEANTTSDRIAVLNGGILQQIGTPVKLYDAPVNSFVAGFLGTANILQGTVSSKGNELFFISNKGFRIPILKQNKKAELISIRPQNIRILPFTKDYIKNKKGKICYYIGIVVEKEFLGATLRYKIKVNDELLFVDKLYQSNESIFEKADKVIVTINPKFIVFLNK